LWKNHLHAINPWRIRPRSFAADTGAQMKITLAILWLVILGNSALAQYGVSNQRDIYGNLVHNGGATSPTGVNQSTPNSNGAIRNMPIQPPTNPGSPPNAQKINRPGSGAN
jgi:hypothetical protein